MLLKGKLIYISFVCIIRKNMFSPPQWQWRTVTFFLSSVKESHLLVSPSWRYIAKLWEEVFVSVCFQGIPSNIPWFQICHLYMVTTMPSMLSWWNTVVIKNMGSFYCSWIFFWLALIYAYGDGIMVWVPRKMLPTICHSIKITGR